MIAVIAALRSHVLFKVVHQHQAGISLLLDLDVAIALIARQLLELLFKCNLLVFFHLLELMKLAHRDLFAV